MGIMISSIGGNQMLKAYNSPCGKLISLGYAEYLATIIEMTYTNPVTNTVSVRRILSEKKIHNTLKTGIVKTSVAIRESYIFLFMNPLLSLEKIHTKNLCSDFK